MKKFLTTFSLIFLGFVANLTAQEDTIRLRKNRFHFNIGLEYRITPFYEYRNFQVNSESYGSYTNIDTQNSGVALNIGTDYFLTKNFGLGFSTSFRYDLIVLETTSITSAQGVSAGKYGLLIDYHIGLFHYFRISKKADIFLQAGFSALNGNSAFGVKETYTSEFNDNGEILTVERFSSEDYSYFANYVQFGYSTKKAKFYLGLYTTTNTEYFDVTTRFTVPHFGAIFKLGEL